MEAAISSETLITQRYVSGCTVIVVSVSFAHDETPAAKCVNKQHVMLFCQLWVYLLFVFVKE
jgi:hypothetical protein